MDASQVEEQDAIADRVLAAGSHDESLLQEPPPPPPSAPPRPLSLLPGLGRQVARAFFVTSAVVCALCALLFGLLLPAGGAGLSAAAGFGAVAALALLALAARGAWVPRAMLAVFAGASLVIASNAFAQGWGVGAPGFSFYGLMVCLLCVAAGPGWGLALAAVCAAAALAVAVAAQSPAGIAGVPLLALALCIASGLAGGVLTARVLGRYARSAGEREQRFRGLLHIAADAYWEIDEHYRLKAGQRGDSALGVDELGRTPWENSSFVCDPDALDALIADLDTRLPLRDRRIAWESSNGELRTLLVRGEPRFDERGVFQGYWGVARDVTDEIVARQELAATETRYQELFARIPTPLVLHRNGRVADANPAGLALLGAHELDEIVGRDLLQDYEGGDSRERERRRIEQLENAGIGTALPVADFRLALADGRRLSVRATAVRIEAGGAPATLAIYVDDTERRAAEEAVRRSEAMLSHLVATSPDMIVLAELASGRIVMVNKAFERSTGYGANEVIGHSAPAMGLWGRPEDRRRFIHLLETEGVAADMSASFEAKGGEMLLLRIAGARFAMDRRDYVVLSARDVGAAERARLEREALLENASFGICYTRSDHFVLANPHYERMLGWGPGEIIGRHVRVVWPSDEACAAVSRAVDPALARGESVEFEGPAMRRDGSTFVCRILGKPVDPEHPATGGTVWFVEDVTERRQAEAELAAARDAALAANQAKSRFLANTSHELRTPLNGLLHLAELARDPATDAARRNQYLDQVVDSARSLAGIISDILDLSKIEAGRLQIENAPFDLGELLNALHSAWQSLATSRSLVLEFEVGPGVAGTVEGDPLRVRQILGNYLGNALKFTAAGRVRLVAQRQGGRVRFEVHDSGPGIEPEKLQRLFQPFTQADESTTRRFGGTGLGLSICRELAALMGGVVGVSSEPGVGSRFWTEIPLPAVDGPITRPVPGADAADLQGLRVLLVEDNPVNMTIATALLERWGALVEQAHDGRQALDAVAGAAAQGRPFDAVLMDVQMPVMSGYEATRELRRRPEGYGLPIVALTAAALVSEREAAADAGMDDFLTKPIDAAKLRQTVARWARRAAPAAEAPGTQGP